jgi:UDP-N-acetylglucosamine--N-acetylmuramyl-(pentapeptide) pyrophosphoryl-undecaprenol N-acetylglucosamine transferase
MPRDDNMRILITCGGTGGHIFPAIALAEELRKRGYADSVFVVDRLSNASEYVERSGFRCHCLNVPKMPYGFSLKWIGFIAKLIHSRLKAGALVADINPDVAVGFGAYVSGPVIQAALSMKIKTMIHEQNALLGRANRILSKKVDKVCLSFKSSQNKKNSRFVLTGNPVRRAMLDNLKTTTKQQALSLLRLSQKRKTLLVLGGSKGASAINKVVSDMTKILNQNEKNLIQIIHITGHSNLESVEQDYRMNQIIYWVRGFYDDMALCYKAADLMISRAGGATIAEAAIFGVPAIFIPYPWAGSHQGENARSIARQGGAVLLEQKRMSAQDLKKNIFSIITDEKGIRQMSFNMRSFSELYAAEMLADQVMELAGVR